MGRLPRRSGCRAYAHDIARVVEGGSPSCGAMQARLGELAGAAGFRLKPRQVVLIPLDWRLAGAETLWRAVAPEWAAMRGWPRVAARA